MLFRAVVADGRHCRDVSTVLREEVHLSGEQHAVEQDIPGKQVELLVHVYPAGLLHPGDDTSRLLHRRDHAVEVVRPVPRTAVRVDAADHDLLAFPRLDTIGAVLPGYGWLRHTSVRHSRSASLLLLRGIDSEQAHGDSIEESISIGRP